MPDAAPQQTATEVDMVWPRRMAVMMLVPLAVCGDALSNRDVPAKIVATVEEAAVEPALAAESTGAVERESPALERDWRRYSNLVAAVSHAYGVDAALVHAVILAESSYDPNALSLAGASGLMQLMPETARRHGVRDLFDPADNIRGGVKHLKELLVLFDGDVELALAAYNAGANAVIRAGNRIPPYAQTAAYVPKVIDYYRRFQAHRD
jgi:soluble lytic murein transglycosylase-like protein